MLNRKSPEAAFRQVNFGRLGALVHDNGQALDSDSLPYLEALRAHALNWVAEVDKEIIKLRRQQPKERTPSTWRNWHSMGCWLLAGIIWTGPKLTPQQAADVLRPNATQVASPVGTGPTVTVIDSTLPMTPFPPARRLDGTLLTQPVTVYGQTRRSHR